MNFVCFLNNLQVKTRGPWGLYRSPDLPSKMFKGFCYTRLYLNKLESPCPKDTPCQISKHSGQWFMRRRFLKIYQICFLILPIIGPQPLYLNKS